MARGDHPGRTPFYGILLSAVALLACWPAASITVTWLAVTLYAVSAVAAGTGFVMTLRTSSP